MLSGFVSFGKGGGMAADSVSVLTSEAITVLLSSTFYQKGHRAIVCFFLEENSNDKINIGINLFTDYSFVKNKLMASRLVKFTANLQ